MTNPEDEVGLAAESERGGSMPRSATEKHRRVNLRKTHPALYHSILTVGVMGVLMAGNFWYSAPTFNPYGIDKNIIGAIFFVIGAGQLVFLTLVRDLRMVRVMLAASLSWMFFWGWSNTEQFFAGNASLQLPLLYLAVSILQIPLAIEAPVNPMTEKE